MGLFDFFTRGKGERDEKAVERLKKKLLNKHQQTAERKHAIALLEEIGTESAIYAILARFSYHTPGTIVDEDEKELAFSAITRAGEKAIKPLEEYIGKEGTVYWPIRALATVAGEERAISTVIASIEAIDDRFELSMQRLEQLVSCLRDFKDGRVKNKLIELSADDSEEIRFLAIDGLSVFADEQDAVDAIVARLAAEDETIRVKTFVVDLLLEHQWNVKRFKKQIIERIPEQYFIDDTGIIRKK